jgi:glycosyltransferase involved in cell wall biosynthesis
MNIKPKVSIVIPTYNRAHLISKTIDSVLQQSIHDIEMIIVDDFSSDFDDLQRVVKNYNNPKISLLRHQSNLHGSAARNTGIKAAKGEYLALLDSDDIWPANKLEEYLDIELEDNEVLYSQLQNSDGVFPLSTIKVGERAGDYLFVNNGCMQTSTLFMPLPLAQQVLFDETLKRFQDFDFVIRLQSAGAKFVFLPKVLCYMCDDAENRISNNTYYEPSIYWLNKIIPELSYLAACSFYCKRVVRLMVLSRNQSKIIKLMPKSISEKMSWTLKNKLLLMSVTPSFVYILIQKTWHIIKKLRKSI